MDKQRVALGLAAAGHKDQLYGDAPYITHLYDVVNLVKQFSDIFPVVVNTNDLICAAWLHDAIEDTHITYQDIKKVVGESVAEIVYACTDELGRNRKERKAKTYPKLDNFMEGQIVKLCDRLANVKNCVACEEDGLLKMYRREFSELEKKFRDQFPVLDPLWKAIERELK